MKKNISVISMDPILQEWLLQKLIKEPPESDSANELLSGIYDMISGDINSLLLSTANHSEIPSVNLSDEMKIGELVINSKSRSVIRMGEEISLTPKEFDILYFLAENRGEVYLPKSRSTRQCGRKIIFWMTAISWRLSENCEKRLNRIRMNQSTY